MTNEEQGQKMGQIIAKAWADEAFKQRLLADATAVLKEEGVEVPEGMTVKAVENTDKLKHIVLPARSGESELSNEELMSVAGGVHGWMPCKEALDPSVTRGLLPY